MNSLLIVLGLFSFCFTACRGLPASIPVNDAVLNNWKNLMDASRGENHGLQESVAIFTDAKTMPFTVTCYSEPCCLRAEQVLCPSYYELMMAVNASSNVSVFNVTGIEESVANPNEISPTDAEGFCKYFAKIFTNYNVTWSNHDLKEKLQHEVYCSTLCITSYGASPKLYVKPMCNAMSLMSAALQNAPPSVKPTAQQPLAAEQAKVTEAAKSQAEKSDIKIPEIVGSENKEQDTKKEGSKSAVKLESQKKTTTATLVSAAPPVQVETEVKLPPAQEKDLKGPVQNDKNQVGHVPKVSPIEKPDESAKQPSKEIKNQEKQETKLEQTQEEQKVTSQQDVGLDEMKEDNNIPVKANEQPDDLNSEIYADNTDDLQKSEQKNYSDEKDGDEFNPPQADTQQTPKDLTDEELVERKAHKILTQTSDGVSANYLPASDPFYEESGSNFFAYFLAAMFICILLYVLYHNKTKVLALILEGRRGQKGRGGRRKHTAQYRKLDTNLEEAITSSTSGRSSQIIY